MRAGIGAALGFVLLGTSGYTAVVDSAANGFTIRTVVNIGATPAKVWEVLVGHIGQWWDSEHTYTGDAANLSIDARAGGCFCEKLPGGGVQHLQVVYVEPGQMLRMVGGLGPLQGLAVAGSQTWTLKPSGAGAELTLVYAVGGYLPGDAAALPQAVDAVLAAQIGRLKQYVETGAVPRTAPPKP